MREVEVEAQAIAADQIARSLAGSALNATYRFTGFLANRSLKNKRIVFHITAFESFDRSPE